LDVEIASASANSFIEANGLRKPRGRISRSECIVHCAHRRARCLAWDLWLLESH
jgi:hypothetical protein